MCLCFFRVCFLLSLLARAFYGFIDAECGATGIRFRSFQRLSQRNTMIPLFPNEIQAPLLELERVALVGKQDAAAWKKLRKHYPWLLQMVEPEDEEETGVRLRGVELIDMYMQPAAFRCNNFSTSLSVTFIGEQNAVLSQSAEVPAKPLPVLGPRFVRAAQKEPVHQLFKERNGLENVSCLVFDWRREFESSQFSSNQRALLILVPNTEMQRQTWLEWFVQAEGKHWKESAPEGSPLKLPGVTIERV